MNALVILLVAAVILILGYIFYGGWLARQWGVDDSIPTPAHTEEDDVDYMPTPPYVVIGHHFSSIAGAGPINGPIQAAVFGWVPVLLWVLIGGIFFGAMHDFGALFASLRHKGQTLAALISENIDDSAKRLFCIFAFLTLVLVVAAFASIVANTFADPDGSNIANSRTAMISMLFILVAIIWGAVTRGRRMPFGVSVLCAVLCIEAVIALGYNMPFIHLSYEVWMVILGVYILIAAVAPVWILLQPRDYLSSYLLYGMIIIAIVGIVGASLNGAAGNLDIPAFTGFDATGLYPESKVATTGLLFPALFITIACGAISGFHSLVASGTTSKQLDREAHAQPVSYGAMLVECLLAIISLCAVGFVWTGYVDGTFAAPTAVFASGLSQMVGTFASHETVVNIIYSLLILAVSAFCLTSLDTSARIGRMMFQELFLRKGETIHDVNDPVRKTLTNPYVATVCTVVPGVALGMTGYSIIWPLFGAANQLLAALALLAVCSWLGNVGRNNKMFYVPMVFMLAVTLTSLSLTIYHKGILIATGADLLVPAVQLVIALILLVLAIVLAAKGVKVIFGKKPTA